MISNNILFREDLKVYTMHNVWMFYVALAMSIVCIIALGCCPGVRRTFPMNLIFLGLFVSDAIL